MRFPITVAQKSPKMSQKSTQTTVRTGVLLLRSYSEKQLELRNNSFHLPAAHLGKFRWCATFWDPCFFVKIVSLSKLQNIYGICKRPSCIPRIAAWRPSERCLRKTHAAQPFSFAQAVSFAGYEEMIDRMEGDITVPSSSFCILVLQCLQCFIYILLQVYIC